MELDKDSKVQMTLLSGKNPAVTVELPENPSNPFYEPTFETAESLALQNAANDKLIATPEQVRAELKQQYPQYDDEVFRILEKPGGRWSKEESKVIEKLVTKGDREALKLVQERLKNE